MNERTILASFRDPDQAHKVEKKLRALGIDTIQIDSVSPYPGEPVQRVMNPISGTIPALGKLTLGADFSSRDASILAAADPSASGLAGGIDMSIGENILLTVVCDSNKVDQAVQLIRENGGNT